jgi:hypothetical protein
MHSDLLCCGYGFSHGSAVQCCENGTAENATFCLSGTRAGMLSGAGSGTVFGSGCWKRIPHPTQMESRLRDLRIQIRIQEAN